MKRYQIVVGNIGQVLDTDAGNVAWREYRAWIGISRSGHSRAANEPVTLFKDGDIRAEFFPSNKGAA